MTATSKANRRFFIEAVLDAMHDRLEAIEQGDITSELLQCVANRNLTANRNGDYLWGIVEQASHTLWFGGGFESPAELNALLEEALCDYLVRLHKGERDEKFVKVTKVKLEQAT